MVTAYSYVRFSSKGQKDGDSIRRQVEASRKYAAAQGWHLDESLRPVEGVSAWKGKHRESGSLATFLTLCDEGKVARGSWLIVEAFDRLSREKTTIALTTFLQIIGSGVGIVTLIDDRQYTDDSINQNTFELMYSIAMMAAANEYSRKLSERVRAAREAAFKDLAAGRRAVIHGKPPYWCQYDRETRTYKLHPERAKIMREAVRLATDGVGTSRIAKMFTARGYKPHSSQKVRWKDTSLGGMLRNRALIGEYTPKQIKEGKRHDRGDPIPDYYPPLLTRDEFYALQGTLATRNKAVKGRRGSGIMFNLFGRVLKCGHDGTPMQVVARRNQRGDKKLYTSLANQSFSMSFPAEPLQAAFLTFVSEVKLRSAGGDTVDEVAVWRGQLAERQARLKKLEDALADGEMSKLGIVVKIVAKLQAESDDLTKLIEAATAARHRPATNPADVKDLTKMLAKAKGDEVVDLKQRIRMAIAEVVDEARIWMYGNTVKRVAIVRVTLRDRQERVLAVKCHRGHEPWAITDDRLDPQSPEAEVVLDPKTAYIHHAALILDKMTAKEATAVWPGQADARMKGVTFTP